LTAANSPDRRAVETRLALIYGATFLVFGVQSPFLPVWLSARGLGVAEIAWRSRSRASSRSSSRRRSADGRTGAAASWRCSRFPA
jgi:hypothetical protein